MKKIKNLVIDYKDTTIEQDSLLNSQIFKELRNSDWIWLADSGLSDACVLKWSDWRIGLQNLMTSKAELADKQKSFDGYKKHKPSLEYANNFKLSRHKLVLDEKQIKSAVFDIMRVFGLDYSFVIDLNKEFKILKSDLICLVNHIMLLKHVKNVSNKNMSIFDLPTVDNLIANECKELIAAINASSTTEQLTNIYQELMKHKWISI